MKIKTIQDLSINEGTKVILRLDLNVPFDSQGNIADDFRITESIPTIKILHEMGAKIIVLAHVEKGSLEKIALYLGNKLESDGIICKFDKDILTVEGIAKYDSKEYQGMNDLKNGGVLVLENVRMNLKEKEKNVEMRDAFGKELSALGEVFVNEAFSASHRDHASITSIPKFLPSCLGPNFIKEISELEKGINGAHPMLLILGGAKFETKLGLLEKFEDIADTIFVGGALAHTFWKIRGQEIGTSLIDNDVKLSEKILKSKKIFLPRDIQNQNKENKLIADILPDDKITDFGQNTFAEILNILDTSKTVIWNGPLDYYEAGYDWGTRELIKALSKMTDKTIILGGGDTVAEINKVKETNPDIKFTHVSTGGGAMIDFLSNGTLPGIEAVTNK